MATCSCGAMTFHGHADWRAGLSSCAWKYCASCGDKLLPNGTVESRAELERDRKRLDKLDDALTRETLEISFVTHVETSIECLLSPTPARPRRRPAGTATARR